MTIIPSILSFEWYGSCTLSKLSYIDNTLRFYFVCVAASHRKFYHYFECENYIYCKLVAIFSGKLAKQNTCQSLIYQCDLVAVGNGY